MEIVLSPTHHTRLVYPPCQPAPGGSAVFPANTVSQSSYPNQSSHCQLKRLTVLPSQSGLRMGNGSGCANQWRKKSCTMLTEFNSFLTRMRWLLSASVPLVLNCLGMFAPFGADPTRASDLDAFFREGRTRAENTLILKPSKPDPAIPVNPNSQFWQYLVFQSAGASLWMPPGTLSEENIVLNTASGTVNFRAIAANTKDSRYVAAYTPNLTAEQLASPDKLFSAVLQRISAGKFAVKQDRSVTWQGRLGREVMLQSNSETIVFRIFLSNQKIYALGVRYPGLKEPSRQVNGYLGSFQFL